MLKLSLIIGIYSYLVLFLGVFGFLYKDLLLSFTLVYFFTVLIYLLKVKRINLIRFKKPVLDNTDKFLILILVIQALVNLVGVFGPELSFDALWYHLTLPKLYLENHSIFNIPGGLLYYSSMPKAIEMLYIPALAINGEMLAKLIHFSFGIACLITLYKLSRIFLSQKLSLLTCVIFYANLVIGWESISAYVDLGWAFFEIVSFYYFVLWSKKKDFKYLLYSAVALGFALSSKIVAFNSLIILSNLAVFVSIKENKTINETFKVISSFILVSILIPLPWFILAFKNTGNPFYPLFDKSLHIIPHQSIWDFLNLFIRSSDPISPLYLIFLPLVIIFYKRMNNTMKLMSLYSALALILWLLISSLGGSRFMIPYLAAFSILCVGVLSFIKNKILFNYLFIIILSVSLLSILYRGVANSKYIPVILGNESKTEFLSRNLNFSYGDFFDTDNYFKYNIKSSDKVLLYGFHNLYYVDFPFIDSSWVKKGDKFNYIAVQNSGLPARFSNWRQVYYNSLTKVGVYSLKGQMWEY